MMKIVEFECPVTFSDEEIRAFISEQIKDLGVALPAISISRNNGFAIKARILLQNLSYLVRRLPLLKREMNRHNKI